MADTPDHTAVRVALWRALHVEIDPPPHVLVDELGLQLAAPDDGWRLRPDMDPQTTRSMRASIVARARFVEDLVAERGAPQYAIRELAERGARASGTPFLSFYAPHEIVAIAREAGFRAATHVSAAALAERYFAGRADGLRPATSEQLLIATA